MNLLYFHSLNSMYSLECPSQKGCDGSGERTEKSNWKHQGSGKLWNIFLTEKVKGKWGLFFLIKRCLRNAARGLANNEWCRKRWIFFLFRLLTVEIRKITMKRISTRFRVDSKVLLSYINILKELLTWCDSSISLESQNQKLGLNDSPVQVLLCVYEKCIPLLVYLCVVIQTAWSLHK